jgi:hypothetical protein
MSPLGATSGGPAAIPAGGERGSELGPTRVRFGGSIVGEELPEGGHAGGGGRRGCLSGEVGARLDLRTGRRATVELEEVSGVVVWWRKGAQDTTRRGTPMATVARLRTGEPTCARVERSASFIVHG